MNERDYINEVDGLRASDSLRERVAALPGQKRRRHFPKRWMGLCACLAVVLLGTGAAKLIFDNGGVGGSAGGAGHDEGSSTFMSYAGPVFPLSVLEDGAGLTARRDLTWDFSPWEPRWISNEEEAAARTDLTEAERQQVLEQYMEWFPKGGYFQSSRDILVTDTYTLTNGTDADRTVTLLYPFAGSLNELDKLRPTLTADGAALDTQLHPGKYVGGFRGVAGSTARESINLDHPDSWEDYRDALSDGSYLERALGDYPDLTGIPATVYKFTDPWGEPEDDDGGIPNPSIRATFGLDYDKTTVLSYGFHSGSFDREAGFMGQGFSILQPGERGYGEQVCYLIVLGEDITDLNTQGYVTGGFDTHKTIDSGVTISRYEADLDDALREVFDRMWAARMEGGRWDAEGDYELYYGLLCDHLARYGVLSEDAKERYDTGRLSDLDFDAVDRVFYLSAPVTIPAGGSVTITAASVKEASFDHYCAHTENQGVYGYGLAPRLGTNLTFTGLTARLTNTQPIQIVRQNMGFDLENGISQVALDPNGEHYYLEVRNGAP